MGTWENIYKYIVEIYENTSVYELILDDIDHIKYLVINNLNTSYIDSLKEENFKNCAEILINDIYKDYFAIMIKKNNYIYIEDSIYICAKCKSKKIYSDDKQTRSTDEAATVFHICTSCGYTWHIN
jgi:DNA-directed RNA polymerase subunit M/transcription elongation factor TFIIS